MQKKKMLKTCFGSLPVSDEADEVELRYFGGRDTRAQVFDVKDPVMRCGVEGSQVSDGGGLACFHFRLTDFGFFFPQCSRITNCFVTRMWFSVFFLLLDFWNKSRFEM